MTASNQVVPEGAGATDGTEMTPPVDIPKQEGLIDVEDAHRYYKFYTEKDVIDPAFQLSDSALWGPDGLAPWQPGETTENRRQ